VKHLKEIKHHKFFLELIVISITTINHHTYRPINSKDLLIFEDKFFPCLKVCRVYGGKSPCILDFGSRWRQMISFTVELLSFEEEIQRCPLARRLAVVFRSGI
jgi:hypothetical protein